MRDKIIENINQQYSLLNNLNAEYETNSDKIKYEILQLKEQYLNLHGLSFKKSAIAFVWINNVPLLRDSDIHDCNPSAETGTVVLGQKIYSLLGRQDLWKYELKISDFYTEWESALNSFFKHPFTEENFKAFESTIRSEYYSFKRGYKTSEYQMIPMVKAIIEHRHRNPFSEKLARTWGE